MTENEYNAIAMLSEANAALRLAIDAINDAIPHIFPDGSDLLLEAIAKIEKQAEKKTPSAYAVTAARICYTTRAPNFMTGIYNGKSKSTVTVRPRKRTVW